LGDEGGKCQLFEFIEKLTIRQGQAPGNTVNLTQAA
jgi:hypothetical protein